MQNRLTGLIFVNAPTASHISVTRILYISQIKAIDNVKNISRVKYSVPVYNILMHVFSFILDEKSSFIRQILIAFHFYNMNI